MTGLLFGPLCRVNYLISWIRGFIGAGIEYYAYFSMKQIRGGVFSSEFQIDACFNQFG